MHWAKKAVNGMFFTLFLFIALVFLEILGCNPFGAGFLTEGGLMLLLFMGIIETSFVFME